MFAFYFVAFSTWISGIKFYSTANSESIAFDVRRNLIQIKDGFRWVAYIYMISFIAMAVLTVLMMMPIYDKFSWDKYQLVGLDRELQKAFKDIQLAKGSFLIFFCICAMQLFSLVYFEMNGTY